MIEGIEHITPYTDKTMPSIQKSPVKMLNSIGSGQFKGKKRCLDSAIAALYGGVDSQTSIDMYNVSRENGHMNGADSLEPGELNSSINSPKSPTINGVKNFDMPKVNRGLSFAEIAHINGKERNEIPLEVAEDESNGAKTESVEEIKQNGHVESNYPQVDIPKESNGAELKQTEKKQMSMPCIWYSDIENQENEQPVFRLDPKTPDHVEKSAESKVEDIQNIDSSTTQKVSESKLSEVNGLLNGHLMNGHHVTNGSIRPQTPPQTQQPAVSEMSPDMSPQSQNSMTPTDPLAEPEAVCPECRKVFKRKVYLQRHMEREHWSTAKVFRCADCGYETKHQSNLSVHRRTHTGERPYHCGACGQRYTQGHLLKSHIRSRHNGNMVYYKLDKKGDGTRSRGRRSLCVEDQLSHMEMPPIKQPKIESLLSAMAQGGSPNNHNNPNLGLFINSTIGFMGSPFLSGGHKMLPFVGGAAAGLNGNMQNGASQLLGGNNFLAPQPSLPVLPPGFGLLSNPNGLKFHSPQLPSVPSMGAKSPEHPGPKVEELTMPQDLSVKKPDDREDGSLYSSDSDSERKVVPPAKNGPIVIQPIEHHVKLPRREMTPETMDMADDLSSTGTQSPKSCEPADCKHCFMLQDLRKNVVRMLSILTPDLNIDNGINYDTDQVDQLLHEVIYSNVDDEMKSK